MPNPKSLPPDSSFPDLQHVVTILEGHWRRTSGLQDLMAGVEARVSALEKLAREGSGSGHGRVRVGIENKSGEVCFRPQGALTTVSGSIGGLDVHIRNEDGVVYFEPCAPLLTSATTASSRGFWGTGKWAKVLVFAGVLYYYRREVRVVGRSVVAGVRVAVERVGGMGGGDKELEKEEEEKGEKEEEVKTMGSMLKETQEEGGREEEAQGDDEEVKREEQEETEQKNTETKQQPTTAPNPPTHPSATQPDIRNEHENQAKQGVKKPAILFYGDIAYKPECTHKSDFASTVAFVNAMEAHKKPSSTQTDSIPQSQPQPQPHPAYSRFPPGARLPSHRYAEKVESTYAPRMEARSEMNCAPAPAPAPTSVSSPPSYAAMGPLSIYNEWNYPPRQKSRFETNHPVYACAPPSSSVTMTHYPPGLEARSENKPVSSPAPVLSSSSSSSSQGYYAHPFACPPRLAPPVGPAPPTPTLPPQQQLPSAPALDTKYGDDDADAAALLWEVEAEVEAREQKIQKKVNHAAAVASGCTVVDKEGDGWYLRYPPVQWAGRGTEGFARAVEEALREGDEASDDEEGEEDSDDEGSYGDDEEDSDDDEDYDDDEEDSDDEDEEDDNGVTSSCSATLAASTASADGTASSDPILTPESPPDSMHDDTPGFVEEHAWLDEPIVDMSDKLVFCAGWPVVGYGGISKS